MRWKHECAAIVPCLNESRTIETLVSAIRCHLPTVLVIDDGSTDGTGELAQKAGAAVLNHSLPQGKGACLAEGLRQLAGDGFLFGGTLDGDGQHAPGDLPRFFECAERTGADLVIGNRMGQAGQMPWLRRLANRWMSRRLSRLTGTHLPDSQCGYRLIRLSLFEEMELKTAHFEIESEILTQALALGGKVEFVAIEPVYARERSKIRVGPDTIRWLRWFARARRQSKQKVKE